MVRGELSGHCFLSAVFLSTGVYSCHCRRPSGWSGHCGRRSVRQKRLRLTQRLFKQKWWKIQRAIANPLNYSYVFVLAMMGGAFFIKPFEVTARFPQPTPHVWRVASGLPDATLYVLGGLSCPFWRPPCRKDTSGHMMSGDANRPQRLSLQPWGFRNINSAGGLSLQRRGRHHDAALFSSSVGYLALRSIVPGRPTPTILLICSASPISG